MHRLVVAPVQVGELAGGGVMSRSRPDLAPADGVAGRVCDACARSVVSRDDCPWRDLDRPPLRAGGPARARWSPATGSVDAARGRGRRPASTNADVAAAARAGAAPRGWSSSPSTRPPAGAGRTAPGGAAALRAGPLGAAAADGRRGRPGGGSRCSPGSPWPAPLADAGRPRAGAQVAERRAGRATASWPVSWPRSCDDAGRARASGSTSPCARTSCRCRPPPRCAVEGSEVVDRDPVLRAVLRDARRAATAPSGSAGGDPAGRRDLARRLPRSLRDDRPAPCGSTLPGGRALEGDAVDVDDARPAASCGRTTAGPRRSRPATSSTCADALAGLARSACVTGIPQAAARRRRGRRHGPAPALEGDGRPGPGAARHLPGGDLPGHDRAGRQRAERGCGWPCS